MSCRARAAFLAVGACLTGMPVPVVAALVDATGATHPSPVARVDAAVAADSAAVAGDDSSRVNAADPDPAPHPNPASRAEGAAESLAAVPLTALVPESRLGPLRTRVACVQGPALLRGASARLLVSLCNASTDPIRGDIELLPTAAWQVRPARRLPFVLDGPDACTTHTLALALPADTSPGPYDCVLRVHVGDEAIGTLRTRVVVPVEWIAVGPFAPPSAGALLPPERGVNLEKGVPGLQGEVRWQRVAAAAYDATGALEMDVVFGAAATPRCACALTVFDLAAPEKLHWSSTGAERLVLDGRLLVPGQPMRLGPGRHTLLARSCAGPAGWRLGVTLLREDGSWPRHLDNDLVRFLPGFDAPVVPPSKGTQRHVTLALREPAAREVQVLGTFNAWVPWPLERGGGGVWKRDLVLPPGRYAYKLRIDGRLLPDPSAPRREADGFGGTNSLLIVP